MNISGQKKISIYDPLTGTVVQLNNISEEGEFVDNPSFIRDSNGGRMFAGDDHKAEFMSLDDVGYDQLETWMRNRTLVQFVTYGLDEHILWYEDTSITVKRNSHFSPYKRNGFKVSFERAGGIHSIYKGSNILYAIFGFKDGNGNSKADNYNMNPSTGWNPVFSNGQQQINSTTATSMDVSAPVFKYPIAGASLIHALAPDYNNTGAQLYGLSRIYNFAGSGLLTLNSSIEAGHSFTTPANIYTIELNHVYLTSGFTGKSIHFKVPYFGAPRINFQNINY